MRKINKKQFIGIIYSATNYENNKKYIGQTIESLKRRKQAHLKAAGKYKNKPFYRALNKYISSNERYIGINFNWEIIESIKNTNKKRLIQLLHQREIHFIAYFKTFKNGYNLTYGGNEPDYKH